MYFISNTDGIPVLSEQENEDTLREATVPEVKLYTDFWTEYLDRVESGEAETFSLDDEVRRKVLRGHGIIDDITYLELDAITHESAPHQCTVATIQFPGHIPDTVLESIGERLVGKTVADVMDDQGFHWWTDPVSHDTVLVDACIDRT